MDLEQFQIWDCSRFYFVTDFIELFLILRKI